MPSAMSPRAIGPSRGPAPPRLARPPSGSVVDVCWTVLAQVFLKIGKPSSKVPTQPALGKEPKVGRGMVANPLRIHELTHVPASTERD